MTEIQRHPGLATHCCDLEEVRAGDTAAASVSDDDSAVSLFVLPMFTWVDLGEAVGKKSRAYCGDGQRWLMPVRIKWDHDPVLRLAEGHRAIIGYRVDAPGFNASGRVTFTASSSRTEADSGEFDPLVEESWVIETLTPGRREATIAALREAGHQAYWRRLLHFSDYAAGRIDISHDRMRSEIYSTVGIWHAEWIDETVREQILARLVLGEGNTESAVQRMLAAQIQREDIFDRVDPYRHAALFIKRAAAEQVYAAIDDPRGERSGKLIREAAAQHGTNDPKRLRQLLDAGGGKLAGVKASIIERGLHPVPNSSVKNVEVETLTGDAPVHTIRRDVA